MSNKHVAKGTTTAHFVKFINKLLDIMNMGESIKGHCLLLGNASIHKSKPMVRKIESRSYRIVCLSPCSPELKPVEQLWAIVEDKMKRDRLMTEENLSSRIADACMMCLLAIFMVSVVVPSVRSSIFYTKDPFRLCQFLSINL